MQQSQAIDMLASPYLTYSKGEIWAELGCGTGTFTRALAHLLGDNSRLYAIDKKQTSLDQIPTRHKDTIIEKRPGDFVAGDFSFKDLDGILMANSLHFVQNQPGFLKRIKQWLKPEGRFLIVEYDTNTSTPWIPHPVGWKRLKELFTNIGFSNIQKISEAPSRYNRANLYSAVVER